MNQVKDNQLLFTKLHEKSIIPSKKDENAGYDLYCSPKCVDTIIIQPGEVKVIPTGISSVFSPKYAAIVKERGSTGLRCMATRMGVIDSGYRGEWNVGINNTGEKPIIISRDYEFIVDSGREICYPMSKAIAQFIMVEVPVLEVSEISKQALESYPSERGDGKLGSSGK